MSAPLPELENILERVVDLSLLRPLLLDLLIFKQALDLKIFGVDVALATLKGDLD